ncbi:MAG: Xaa-Pro peptidase family protein [Candidatus Hydrogenedentes bacterium]|nr:Xaa-Pro peptidase family protein [Candidatus Hydrogenedentota bacterium]
MNSIDGRLSKLREILQKNKCDAFVNFSAVENRYFSGFTGSTSCLVIGTFGNLIFTDFRYEEQVYTEVRNFSIRIVSKNLEEEVIAFLKDSRLKKLAIISEKTNLRFYERLKSEDFEIYRVDDDISSMRMIKDNNEISLIKKACEITYTSLEKALGIVREGISEREIAGYIEYQFKLNGAEAIGFDTIVLFGAKSSLPHGKPSDNKLKPGDVILIDCGCVYKGYHSDITRTFVFGAIPGVWFENIYQITKEAQSNALKFLKDDVSCKEIDYEARRCIAKRGFGMFFGHGLGHGVGLEIHELPRLNKDSNSNLKSGVVVTIEPGIYLPGKGGVRIEDTVVITEEGCEILTNFEKNLIVLD